MGQMRGGVQSYDSKGRVKSEASRLGSGEMTTWINSWTQEVRTYMTAEGRVTVSIREYPGGDLIDSFTYDPPKEAK